MAITNGSKIAKFDGQTLEVSDVPGLDSLDDGKVVNLRPGAQRGRGILAVEEAPEEPILKEEEIELSAPDPAPARIPVHVYDASRPDLPPVVTFTVGADKINDVAVEEAISAVEGNLIADGRWWVRDVWAHWRDGVRAIVVYANKRGV